MALIVCKECDKKISSDAKTCPDCGYPIEEIRQKRKDFYQIAGILALLLLVIILMKTGWLKPLLNSLFSDLF
jgi:predicted nucleic acid-binding Zn ribbon protein